MNQYSLSLNDLKRGDLICPEGSKTKFIVSKNEDGRIHTIEKGKDRKGPVLEEKELSAYNKVNTGENDTDEYRNKIIATYLERHKGSAASREAQSRYLKKRGETANEMNRITELLKEAANREGVTVSEYILLAAEFYEKNKDR